MKKENLNVLRGISPRTFYYWKSKYYFNSLTEVELKKFRAGYQNIVRDEIELGFYEIDEALDNIRQNAVNTGIEYDDALGYFLAETHKERG